MNAILFFGCLFFLGVAHFVGDFFLKILLQKILKLFGMFYSKSGWQLWMHCILYVIPFTPVFYFFQIEWVFIPVLFLTHLIVDGGMMKEIKTKNKRKNMGYLKRLISGDPVLIADQGLHLMFVVGVFVDWVMKTRGLL